MANSYHGPSLFWLFEFFKRKLKLSLKYIILSKHHTFEVLKNKTISTLKWPLPHVESFEWVIEHRSNSLKHFVIYYIYHITQGFHGQSNLRSTYSIPAQAKVFETHFANNLLH